MKRFIVLLQSETDQQTKAFSQMLPATDFKWWHWLPNSWLIVDTKDQFTSRSLIDTVKSAYPGVNAFVSEIESDHWTGFGPKDESTYFPWLHKNWTMSD